MHVCITVDLEEDCPPFRNTHRGMTEGLPRLLDLLEDKKVPATFFTTGAVAEEHGNTIREIVERGHEIGCHGQTHRRLDELPDEEARNEIATATQILRGFYQVTSFRAPNLKLPEHHLKYLSSLGYQLDSSFARYKRPFVGPHRKEGILRIPVSASSIFIRLPTLPRNIILTFLKDPVVVLMHPWEFVNLRHEPLRLDCRFNTGHKALQALGATIDFFSSRGAAFLEMESLVARFHST